MVDLERPEDYIKENLREHSFEELQKLLLEKGWKKEDIGKAYNKIIEGKGSKKIFIYISLAFLFVISVLYVYFFYISPVFVEKPFLEKPSLILETSQDENATQTITSVIKSEHLIFLLNEIGAYKLHNSPIGSIPRIAILIRDTQKEYWFSVSNNRVIEITPSLNVDVRLEANQGVIIDICNSNNTQGTILTYYRNGKVKLNIETDMITLALKGYKELYGYFGITGGFIFKIL